MGLRVRLLLLLVVPMCVAVGGYGLVRLRQEERQLLAEEQLRMEVMATAIQVAVENALRDRQISDIRRLLAEIVFFQNEIDRIRIFDATLRPILVSNPLAIGDEVPEHGLREAMAERRPVQFFQEKDGRRVLSTLVPLRGNRETVRGAMEILRFAGHVDARIAAARGEIVLRVGMLAAILALLIWVGVRQTVVVPIRRLMAGVNALAAGRPVSLPARGRHEFARLARAFNDMAGRLAEAHRRLVTEAEARLDLARQVRQAEQLAVAGRIASEMAHEIGTPLNIISGRAEYVLRDLPPGHPAATHLRTIVAQIDRISGIIASLLDLVRPRKAEVQDVELPPLIGAVLDLLQPMARKKGVRLTTDLLSEPSVRADPNQLQQVAINLLVNALEATPAGGQVVVRARPASGAAEQLGVELAVADSGSGIRPDDLPRVFDPFFTTKPPGQGTGLGLAICREIVREHGGHIEVASEPGAGTTVRVWLPAAAPALSEP
jgi:two-component system NtrC family sensor kinase